MNGWKRLSIIHIWGRRYLRQTIVEHTEGTVFISFVDPLSAEALETHARSIFIRLILFFAWSTLNCSLSLSFDNKINNKQRQLAGSCGDI
jgi:hypothetical protein